MASTLELLALAELQNLQNNTPQLLQKTSIGVSTASYPITVPSGYNRIGVFWRVRSTVSGVAEQLYLRMNGDTSNHYLWQTNQANNNTVSGSASGSLVNVIQVGTVTGGTATADYFASGNFVVDGVADATNFATAVGSGTAYAATNNSWAGTYAGMYNQSGLITSLSVFCASGNIAAGSNFSVWGLS